MSKVTIKSVGLSSNSEAAVVESKEGFDGKLNQNKDGKLYFVVNVEDQSNPFHVTKRTMVISQVEKNNQLTWGAFTPTQFKAAVGTVIENAQVVKENVVPYNLNGREVNTFTTIVFSHENKISVFFNQGHPIMLEDGTILEPAKVETKVVA